MHKISMIFTSHQENGNCNSVELHRIIENIRPEIIFEELSLSNYDKVYKERTLTTLESNAITKYLHNHSIDHIPVDTYSLPNNYYQNVEYMLNRILKGIMIESRDLRNIIEDQSLLIFQNGFNFLNSNHNNILFEKINALKVRILKKINNEKLFQIASLEREVIEKRENEIIDNIYNFSKEHVYNQALLFMGSGHRKSMIGRIEKRRKKEKLEIHWTLFNN